MTPRFISRWLTRGALAVWMSLAGPSQGDLPTPQSSQDHLDDVLAMATAFFYLEPSGSTPSLLLDTFVCCSIGNSNNHSAAGIVDATWDDVAVHNNCTVYYNGVEQATYAAGFCGSLPEEVELLKIARDTARGNTTGQIVYVRQALNGQKFSPRGAWMAMVKNTIAEVKLASPGQHPNSVNVRMGANDQNPADDPNDVRVACREFWYIWRWYFPRCKIIWIGAEVGTPLSTYPHNDEVVAHQVALAVEVPNSEYQSTQTFSHADGIHLDAAGQHDVAAGVVSRMAA